MSGIGGFARDSEGFTIGRAASEARWIPAAREVLAEVARTPHATMTYADLAETLHSRTGIRANAPVTKWIGPFLEHITQACRDAGEPPLAALLVAADNAGVGSAYDGVLRVLGEPIAQTKVERERAAAGQRLVCYQWAGAPTPPGGWARRPVASSRTPTIRRASPPRLAGARANADAAPPATCRTCFTVLPATGRCDYCD